MIIGWSDYMPIGETKYANSAETLALHNPEMQWVRCIVCKVHKGHLFCTRALYFTLYQIGYNGRL